MARVTFTANLHRHLDCPTVEAPGTTLRDVLDHVFASNPRLRGYLLDEHARLRKHVIVFVNDTPVVDRVVLSDPIAARDEVFVFQALSGG